MYDKELYEMYDKDFYECMRKNKIYLSSEIFPLSLEQRA